MKLAELFLLVLVSFFSAYINAEETKASENSIVSSIDKGNIYDVSYSQAGNYAVYVKSDVNSASIKECDLVKRKCISLYKIRGKEKDRDCLSHPQYSTDDKKIYYIEGSGTFGSLEIYVMERGEKTPHHFTDGINYLIVKHGKYENYLVVQKHKYFMLGGTYDFYWLVSPDGNEVAPVEYGEIGSTKINIDLLEEMYAE